MGDKSIASAQAGESHEGYMIDMGAPVGHQRDGRERMSVDKLFDDTGICF
jgi:hypothetical protein